MRVVVTYRYIIRFDRCECPPSIRMYNGLSTEFGTGAWIYLFISPQFYRKDLKLYYRVS